MTTMNEPQPPVPLIIGDDYIELYKALKKENLVASGGEGKHVISQGMVTVNGEVETRKRYKARPGDVIGFGGEQIVITRG